MELVKRDFATGILARIFHELLSRDHDDGRATWQPYRGIGSEAYLNGTSQGEPVLSEVEGTPEDARLPARREGRPYPWSQQVIDEISGLALEWRESGSSPHSGIFDGPG